MYAIVDIETTGGSSKRDSITEVAVIVYDGVEVVKKYETLINPQSIIPPKIRSLTGISNEMVETAPVFEDVAEELFLLTSDKIFVAHNVNFDYSFLREHFHRAGFQWRPKRLCTVRLSRKIMPGFYSYSLGKIAQQLGHQIDNRHRAMGDCDFTLKLFQILLEKDIDDHIKFALNARSREATLPPNLDREIFLKVPDAQGVYLLKGNNGKVLYVGKANNIKKRLADHFRRSTHTGLKNNFIDQVEDLEWVECPNELISLLTEAQLIKKYWPPYNNMMKRISLNWGVFSYYDQHGYGRLNVGRVGKWDKPIVSFRNQREARLTLEALCIEYELCARYLGLQSADGACETGLFGECHNACIQEEPTAQYNRRFKKAVDRLTREGQSLIIKGDGFTEEEKSVILIEKGRFKGHGTMQTASSDVSLEEVRDSIETAYDDQDMQSIIRSYLLQHRENSDSPKFEVVLV